MSTLALLRGLSKCLISPGTKTTRGHMYMVSYRIAVKQLASFTRLEMSNVLLGIATCDAATE